MILIHLCKRTGALWRLPAYFQKYMLSIGTFRFIILIYAIRWFNRVGFCPNPTCNIEVTIQLRKLKLAIVALYTMLYTLITLIWDVHDILYMIETQEFYPTCSSYNMWCMTSKWLLWHPQQIYKTKIHCDRSWKQHHRSFT